MIGSAGTAPGTPPTAILLYLMYYMEPCTKRPKFNANVCAEFSLTACFVAWYHVANESTGHHDRPQAGKDKTK
jgi:hypothetical protein